MRYLNLWQTELPPVLDVTVRPINGAAQASPVKRDARCGVADTAHEANQHFTVSESPQQPAAAPPEPTPADPVWVPWSGKSECPVPLNTLVDIWMQDNEVWEAERAGDFTWQHKWQPGDIIAYRLANPTPRGPCVLPPDHVHAELERLWRSDDTLKCWMWAPVSKEWREVNPLWFKQERYHVGHQPPEGV